jgi:hypothetical protein
MYIIFFIRNFNDFDNILPLIDKCVRQKDYVRVVSLRLNIMDNYLTNFLYRENNVTIEYPLLDNLSPIYKVKKAIIKILNRVIKVEYFFKGVLGKYITQVIFLLKKDIINYANNDKDIINRIVNGINPDIVVCDRNNVVKNKIYSQLTEFSYQYKIPMVILSHGIDLRVHVASNYDAQFSKYKYKKIYAIYVGKIELGNNIRTDKLKSHFVLGSLRFSRQWMNKYQYLCSFDSNKISCQKNKRTIFIALSDTRHLHIQKTAELINKIGKKYNIFLKPHTRKITLGYDLVSQIDNDISIKFVDDISANLIDISDVMVLCGPSSIGIHSIQSKKPLIVVEYVSLMKTYYSKYNVACIAETQSEVIKHIQNICNNNHSCYNDKLVAKFLKFVINQDPQVNIIDEHYRFLLKAVNNDINLSRYNPFNINNF